MHESLRDGKTLKESPKLDFCKKKKINKNKPHTHTKTSTKTLTKQSALYFLRK